MTAVAIALVCGLPLSILLSAEFGYWAGLRRLRRFPGEVRGVTSGLEASIFGLMGLLIAFIVYGSGARWEHRRSLVAAEANAIGTAYLRLDLLPPDTQPELRDKFRKYVRARLDVYQKIPDWNSVNAALARSEALQQHIWKEAVEAVKVSGPAEKSLLISALNAVIDITTDRTVAVSTHPPAALFALLALSAVVATALVGYSMSEGIRNWGLLVSYALVISAALYTIADFEFPRVGFVREDSADQVLVQTLEKMN